MSTTDALSPAPLRLVTIPPSPYCEKARWALDRAGIAYREDGHVPMFHYASSYGAGGRQTVPVLVTPTGVLADSGDILRWADTRLPPERRLYPEDATARAEVEALEKQFGEVLGASVRRWVYFHVLPDRDVFLAAVGPGAPAWESRVFRLFYPLMERILRRGLRLSADGAERCLARIRGVTDQVDARLDGRRWLVGDRFTAADLTFASMMGPVLCPPEYGAAYPVPEAFPPAARDEMLRLRETPSGAFVLRVYREERRSPVV